MINRFLTSILLLGLISPVGAQGSGEVTQGVLPVAIESFQTRPVPPPIPPAAIHLLGIGTVKGGPSYALVEYEGVTLCVGANEYLDDRHFIQVKSVGSGRAEFFDARTNHILQRVLW